MSGGGSVYAQKGSSTGSVYAQKGASSGSVYANHGAAAAPPKKHGHGGLLGAVEHAAHWTAEKAGLAAHDVKTIPGGTVQLVRDEYGALKQSVEHPWVSGASDPNYVDNTPAGKKLNADIKGMAHATVTSVRHPLRDPFQTGLTALAALGVAGGAAGRVAGVSRAGSLGDAAKAAIRTPAIRPRLLTAGDTQVSLHPSANPTMRAGQGLYDRVLQRGLDKNPEGRVAAHAASRIGGSLRETGRYQERMRAVPADLLEQASKRLAPTRGHVPFTGAKRLQRVEQAAMELTSVNTPPEAAAAYHLAQAEKGVNPALNRAVAKLYTTVHRRGMLTENERGDVIVNAAKHPKLAETDVRLANVQGKGDEILARYDVRTREALRAAVDAPGKYRAGAVYEKPTAAKQGAETPALKRSRQRVTSLQGRVERSKAGGFQTVEQATAELNKLTKVHNTALDKIAGRMFGAIDRGDVNFRTRENRRAAQQASGVTKAGKASGASGYKSTSRATVTDQMRAEAEKQVGRMIEANPAHPVAKAWAARAARIDQLQQALNPDLFEKVNRRSLGHVGKPTDPARHAQLEGALAVAERDAATAEKAAASRVKPTGIVGGNSARPGRGHISYAGTEPRAPKSAVAQSSGSIVGEARAPVTSHANQGINISLGRVPKDVTGQQARHFRQIVRFVNTTEHRNAAIRTGSPVRRSARDVLVAIPGETHARIPDVVNEVLGKKKLTHDDVQGIHDALQEYKRELIPGLRDNFAKERQQEPTGVAAPEGHVWVDRNVLGDLAKPGAGPRGKPARTIDTVNSAVTASTVYYKIGHIGTRVLTNAATNIIQGSAHPVEMGRSIKLWHALTDADRKRALAAAGQHGFEAMPHEGSNAVGRFATHGANWWARRADARFRFNSIAYEARRAGFKTPAQFRRMLDEMENPQGLTAEQRARVDYVAKASNRAGIAYDRLNEFERRYIARAIWFYPWLKGTAGFAAHTAMEHPYKSAVLGNLGEQGRQTQQRELGDLPSYEGGLMQLKAPNAAGRPLVADFSTFSPYATPADLLHAGTHPGELSGFFNPVLGATDNLIHGLTSSGGKSTSPFEDALASLVAPTPEAQVTGGFLGRGKDQSKRMFPKSPSFYGMRDPLLRALVGPGMPRRLNPKAGHSAAARERSGR